MTVNIVEHDLVADVARIDMDGYWMAARPQREHFTIVLSRLVAGCIVTYSLYVMYHHNDMDMIEWTIRVQAWGDGNDEAQALWLLNDALPQLRDYMLREYRYHREAYTGEMYDVETGELRPQKTSEEN